MSIESKILIVCAIIGAVISIIGLIFNKELKAFISSKRYKPQKKNVISNYFESTIIDNHDIDVFFYQFGLRKTLPIMDWLYLEYIKFVNKTSKIKKLVIFPTIDNSVKSQVDGDFKEFCENINKVFEKSGINIDIIDPNTDTYFDTEDWVSKDFIESLVYVGSKKYFDFLWDELKIKITSISDFNKFHPVDERIKDIFTHIYKARCIVNYIENDEDLIRQPELNISTILWEWEVEKLGIIKHYSNKKENIIFHPVLGITQMLNKTIPVPVFIENETICIFDSEQSIINKALTFIPFLKKYNLLLESVLSLYDTIERKSRKDIIENGKKQWTSFITSYGDIPKNRKPTKDFFLFLGLIDKIKLKIKNGHK